MEDLSANGTWINQDLRLVRGQRRLLHSGDEISLLNPYKHKKAVGGGSAGSGVVKGEAGAEPGRGEDDPKKQLEAEAATFTFINLNRWVHNSSCRVVNQGVLLLLLLLLVWRARPRESASGVLLLGDSDNASLQVFVFLRCGCVAQ